ncbi:unnamed protein product, partial [Ectocarpus sp. 8 AP-2014]
GVKWREHRALERGAGTRDYQEAVDRAPLFSIQSGDSHSHTHWRGKRPTMSEVVKAGVLEVTVVQATGVDLLAATSTLSRTARRKPALVARVTVDGTTKSGQPAQRSHHPVWFPAQPLNLGDMNASSSTSRARGGTSGARNGGGRGSTTTTSINHSTRLFGRAFSNGNAHPPEREAVNGSLGLARDRYGGGAGDGSGDGGEGSESGNPGHGGGSS